MSWESYKSYINGNYCVLDSGFTRIKRALRRGEDFKAEFPDSIDLKITNRCLIGCPFCHESSGPGGGSFDLSKTKAILGTLPRVGIELAIGGGDVLEIPDKTVELIDWCNEQGFRTRVTINYKSIEKYSDEMKEAIKQHIQYFSNGSNRGTPPVVSARYEILREAGAIGISIDQYIDRWPFDLGTYNTVFHIIAGEFPPADLKKLWENCLNYKRLLILGYKDFGRAKGRPPKYDLGEWEEALKRLIWESRRSSDKFPMGTPIVGFDNLALEQLNVRGAMTEEEWGDRYFGDEFTSSMYVDAVSGLFAPTSRSTERETWQDNGNSIIEYFKKHHE